MKTITVQGVTVEIAAPYAAGHQITEAEAKALNQVRAENIRNNTAKHIKDLLEKNGNDVAAITKEAQALISKYDSEYEFTLASVGGGRKPVDPLEKEAQSIARNLVIAKIKEKGMTQKQYLEQNGEDAIAQKVEELMEHPKIIEAAKKSLAQKAKMAEGLADL